jgi:DNA-binding transcriptional MerR regulator
MDKSPDAFRTISEVAEVLETPAHVLRFWESRFPQIRPVKRAGGRRYYRPTDVALLTGIKHLLHDEGMTIRGVQKILREQGVRHVAGLSGHDLPDDTDTAEAALEAALAANFGVETVTPLSPDQVETAQIVALETALRLRSDPPSDAPDEPADVLPLFDHPAARIVPVVEVPVEVLVEVPVPEAPFVEVPEAEAAPTDLLPTDLPAYDPTIADPREDDPPVADAAPDPMPDLTPPAELSLLDRLRALPPGCLADDPQAQGLRDRLAALTARLAAPPPPAQF